MLEVQIFCQNRDVTHMYSILVFIYVLCLYVTLFWDL